jgi:hypothetical protein
MVKFGLKTQKTPIYSLIIKIKNRGFINIISSLELVAGVGFEPTTFGL